MVHLTSKPRMAVNHSIFRQLAEFQALVNIFLRSNWISVQMAVRSKHKLLESNRRDLALMKRKSPDLVTTQLLTRVSSKKPTENWGHIDQQLCVRSITFLKISQVLEISTRMNNMASAPNKFKEVLQITSLF